MLTTTHNAVRTTPTPIPRRVMQKLLIPPAVWWQSVQPSHGLVGGGNPRRAQWPRHLEWRSARLWHADRRRAHPRRRAEGRCAQTCWHSLLRRHRWRHSTAPSPRRHGHWRYPSRAAATEGLRRASYWHRDAQRLLHKACLAHGHRTQQWIGAQGVPGAHGRGADILQAIQSAKRLRRASQAVGVLGFGEQMRNAGPQQRLWRA
mmetsp:Transcript_67583/g.188597  ORF Transcript_67583/g.188597 Transcript_67583/m.188597 type:complete len:204 (+) Transcript_67583:88-699(+)